MCGETVQLVVILSIHLSSEVQEYTSNHVILLISNLEDIDLDHLEGVGVMSNTIRMTMLQSTSIKEQNASTTPKSPNNVISAKRAELALR